MHRKTKPQKKIRFQETEFFFDNCPICKAMKDAEDEGRDLALKELTQSFRQAKTQDAVVGGLMLENSKQNVH